MTDPGLRHERNPITWAAEDPGRPAIVMGGSGQVTTYGELAERASRLVNLLRSYGLRQGDAIALLSENSPRFHEVLWAGRLGGFYVTPVNRHLGVDEIAYILNDCGAKVLVASGNLPVSAQLTREIAPTLERRLAQLAPIDGFDDYDAELATASAEPPAPGLSGVALQYSSGTTGRPKGIKRPLENPPAYDADGIVAVLRAMGVTEGTTYLSPAPLYHAAPVGFTMAVLRMGGTVVVMERFDPLETLRLIEKHRVQTGQFVPTMFVRLTKLPPEDRARYDLSSLVGVIHAAAPCPIEVKRQMIEWWGPIVYEYWSSSEGAGFTFITSAEWLERPGSVGLPLGGPLHICDENGQELPVGEAGLIWAEVARPYSYLGDPAKDAETTHARGWRSVGDIGRLDEAGYLYLTDRASFMIIRGGVNVYPQEAENALIEHPQVLDAAVIGVPDEDLGEEVLAVVSLVDPADASPALAADLIAWCRDRLAAYKCPRQVDFRQDLPRTETGKLQKKLLRAQYAQATSPR
ncbi:MAG TPA: acyl-CoA synthetase [Mycobacteriales bacterium]